MSPGRSEPSLEPRVFIPFPMAFPVDFKALVIDPITAPIVTPAARKIAVTVTPYFLKIAFTFSLIRSRRESFSNSISLSFSIAFTS